MGPNSYITGVGRTKFGVLDKGIPELAYEAMMKALKDAATPIEDIEAIFIANFCAGPFQNQLHLNSLISGLLPRSSIPIIRVETACAAAGSAAYLAGMSLSRFKKVMVLGVEKMTCADSQTIARNISSAGDSVIDQPEGLIFPAAYALIAQQHFLKYGTSTDDLDAVAFKNHSNANRNELAHFYTKKVDLEMIRNSSTVCSSNWV